MQLCNEIMGRVFLCFGLIVRGVPAGRALGRDFGTLVVRADRIVLGKAALDGYGRSRLGVVGLVGGQARHEGV